MARSGLTTSRSTAFGLAVALGALSLDACSGGTAGVAPHAPSAPGVTNAQGPAVRPQFSIVRSPRPAAGVRRAPARVGPNALSVTISLTPPVAGLLPSSVTTNLPAAGCTAAAPCVVGGPASPAGVPDTFVVDTFDMAGGTGNELDTGSATVTPVVGTNNVTSIVLEGIPASVTIATPFALPAGSAGSDDLTIDVLDADGAPIAGTFATPVVVSDLDTAGTNGSQLTGPAAPAAACPTGTCVQLSSSADTATLNYGGLAEGPQTVTTTVTSPSTGATTTTPSAAFTPTLADIVRTGGAMSAFAGMPIGIDLYATSPGSTGSTGFEQYREAGFTNAPYNKTLSLAGGATCARATIAVTSAAMSNDTVFTATATNPDTAGVCTLTVTDGLTHPVPTTFGVTFSSTGFGTSAKSRR